MPCKTDLLQRKDETLQYYRTLVQTLRDRNDQLVKEIHRLRGCKPLTREQIDKHNNQIKIRNYGVLIDVTLTEREKALKELLDNYYRI